MDSMTNRLLVVLATALASMACVHLARRYAPHAKMKDNHEYAGFMFQLLGLIYGVYLAFTIIAVWEQFGDAEKTATNEAAHVSELWRDAQVFPVANRNQIQDRLYAYTKNVVEKEWPAMDATRNADSTTAASYEDLWAAYYAMSTAPTTPQQSSFYTQSIQELNELGMLRRLRILAASAELPRLMWGLLIGGGLVTIAFMFAFGTRIAVTQYLVTVFVASMLVFSILMVGALEHPFSGDVRIKSEAFESVVHSMDQRLARQRAESVQTAGAMVGQAGAPKKP